MELENCYWHLECPFWHFKRKILAFRVYEIDPWWGFWHPMLQLYGIFANKNSSVHFLNTFTLTHSNFDVLDF